MALVKPALSFELGLEAGFRDSVTTVVWTDITPYVLPWRTGRGREPKKPPAHFDPGLANLTLNNRDRRFDPTNTAGPYYPHLKPARVRLRIRATWLGITRHVFTGYVKRWPPEWTSSATSTVRITAVDALGAPLHLAQIYASMWETVIRHDRPKVWLRLNETTGTLAADSTPNRLDGQYQGTPTLGQASLLFTDPDDKAVRFVSGSRVSLPYKNLIDDYPFTVECWFECGTATTAAKMIFSAYDGAMAPVRQFVQVFISSTGASSGKVVVVVANPYPTGTQVESTITVNDLARRHLAVVFTSSTDFKIFINGTDRTSVSAVNAHAFPNDLQTGYAVGNNPAAAFGDFRFGDTADDILDEVIIYDTALSTTRINRHYSYGLGLPTLFRRSGSFVSRLLEEADWPADHDIDSGESVLQFAPSAGSVVATLQKIEESEQGALFVDEAGEIIFHDRHALLRSPYNTSQLTLEQGVATLVYEPPVIWGNDDAELFNLAAGARLGGATYTVEDTASQAEFGTRALPAMTGLLNESDSEVVDLLTYRVQKYSEPLPSVRQVRLHPAAVPELYPYVLGLGLRSRITVKVAPPGGGPVFSQESHIERITHEVDALGDWWTIWDISAADSASYVVLDDPVRGLLDSGNRVGF